MSSFAKPLLSSLSIFLCASGQSAFGDISSNDRENPDLASKYLDLLKARLREKGAGDEAFRDFARVLWGKLFRNWQSKKDGPPVAVETWLSIFLVGSKKSEIVSYDQFLSSPPTTNLNATLLGYLLYQSWVGSQESCTKYITSYFLDPRDQVIMSDKRVEDGTEKTHVYLPKLDRLSSLLVFSYLTFADVVDYLERNVSNAASENEKLLIKKLPFPTTAFLEQLSDSDTHLYEIWLELRPVRTRLDSRRTASFPISDTIFQRMVDELKNIYREIGVFLGNIIKLVPEIKSRDDGREASLLRNVLQLIPRFIPSDTDFDSLVNFLFQCSLHPRMPVQSHAIEALRRILQTADATTNSSEWNALITDDKNSPSLHFRVFKMLLKLISRRALKQPAEFYFNTNEDGSPRCQGIVAFLIEMSTVFASETSPSLSPVKTDQDVIKSVLNQMDFLGLLLFSSSFLKMRSLAKYLFEAAFRIDRFEKKKQSAPVGHRRNCSVDLNQTKSTESIDGVLEMRIIEIFDLVAKKLTEKRENDPSDRRWRVHGLTLSEASGSKEGAIWYLALSESALKQDTWLLVRAELLKTISIHAAYNLKIKCLEFGISILNNLYRSIGRNLNTEDWSSPQRLAVWRSMLSLVSSVINVDKKLSSMEFYPGRKVSKFEMGSVLNLGDNRFSSEISNAPPLQRFLELVVQVLKSDNVPLRRETVLAFDSLHPSSLKTVLIELLPILKEQMKALESFSDFEDVDIYKFTSSKSEASLGLPPEVVHLLDETIPLLGLLSECLQYDNVRIDCSQTIVKTICDFIKRCIGHLRKPLINYNYRYQEFRIQFCAMLHDVWDHLTKNLDREDYQSVNYEGVQTAALDCVENWIGFAPEWKKFEEDVLKNELKRSKGATSETVAKSFRRLQAAALVAYASLCRGPLPEMGPVGARLVTKPFGIINQALSTDSKDYILFATAALSNLLEHNYNKLSLFNPILDQLSHQTVTMNDIKTKSFFVALANVLFRRKESWIMFPDPGTICSIVLINLGDSDLVVRKIAAKLVDEVLIPLFELGVDDFVSPTQIQAPRLSRLKPKTRIISPIIQQSVESDSSVHYKYAQSVCAKKLAKAFPAAAVDVWLFIKLRIPTYIGSPGFISNAEQRRP